MRGKQFLRSLMEEVWEYCQNLTLMLIWAWLGETGWTKKRGLIWNFPFPLDVLNVKWPALNKKWGNSIPINVQASLVNAVQQRRGKEQRWSMKRRMNRGLDQRRRHCVFYSYRPLAPSVGSKPEQPELQSSPNSPVTKREDAERGREVKHRWTERVKIWEHTFCMYMLQWSHKGVPPPSASLSSFNLSIVWALSVIYEKYDLTKK